jgi:hypothetical protein
VLKFKREKLLADIVVFLGECIKYSIHPEAWSNYSPASRKNRRLNNGSKITMYKTKQHKSAEAEAQQLLISAKID